MIHTFAADKDVYGKGLRPRWKGLPFTNTDCK